MPGNEMLNETKHPMNPHGSHMQYIILQYYVPFYSNLYVLQVKGEGQAQ